MRWEVTTKSSLRDDNKTNKKYKDTIETKTLYISVGDIVGAGKSAAGAVQKLAKDLPEFIKSLRLSNYDKSDISAKTAERINNIVQPLAILQEGMDKYKKIMGVIDAVTPIVKTVALSTGIMFSPGNVAELGQIALGIAQKILISILTSSILRLKEMIWNYEFNVAEFPESTSIIIGNLLKEYDRNNDNEIDKNIFDDRKGKKDSDEERKFQLENEKIKRKVKNIFPPKGEPDKTEPTIPSIPDILDLLGGDHTSESDIAKNDLNGNNFITEKKIYMEPGSESYYKRILFGSLNNKGIYYSDDDGLTWTQSFQKNHSFAKFEKIKIIKNGKEHWRYLAGSTYSVKETKKSLDNSFSVDKYNHYNKDYYDKDCNRYTKREKELLTESASFEELLKRNKINEKVVTEENNAVGIYYSDDDGLTWQPTDIKSGSWEMIFTFPKKVGYNTRVVSSSYDYNGLYYSDDGLTWNLSKFIDKETNEEIEDIDHGRWTFFQGFDGDLVNILSSDNFNCIIDNPLIKINAVENIDLNSQKIDLDMDSKAYQGDPLFENIDFELTGSIIYYIHENYPDRIPHYSEKFWENKIRLINSGEYTMQDAIDGKDLETDYEGDK